MRDLKRAAVREAMNSSERSFGGYSTHALPTRNAERVGDNLPPKVEKLVKKLEDKGMEPDKAWPIAWSIYCRYKNNDSPSCKRKPEEYFKGRKAGNLIPPPPPIEDLIRQLPQIRRQYENRYNPESIQHYLDECFWKIFDAILTSNGCESRAHDIREMGKAVKPFIHYCKNHFNLLRPKQLADKINYDFICDYLETAQTPSYPSGHTTQAYYMAHALSEEHPQLRDKLFFVAKMVAESRVDRGVHFISDNEGGVLLAEKLFNLGIRPRYKRKPEEYFKGRKAFNKFNAPELMGQLLAVLNKHGLDETADKLKRMKVPRLVNDAWVNR